MSAKKLFNVFKIFVLICVLAFSSKVFAQIDLQCEPVPDCVTLGYQQEVECPNGAYVNCPFDASYKKCVNQNCADLGFTTTDKTRWCKKIITCPTDLAYTLCDELDPCASYNLTLDQSLTYDPHCYNCTACNSGSGNRYKCIEQRQAGYYIIDGACTYNPCDGYNIDSATYLANYASEPEVHCQKCQSCVTPEGPTVYKCDNSTPEEGYFVAQNGTCSKDACFDYRLPERLDVGDAENCYDCEQCQVTGENAPLFGGYWKCTVHEENDYHLVGTECVQDPCPGYDVTQAQYESKYGSEDGQHCYDCQKCNNEDSTHNGNWKCTAKQNIESPYSLNGNGECVSDPCAGYDMTQAQKNSFLAQGDNSHCYECRRCTIRTSEFYNSWNCEVKNPIDDHYRLVGEVCEPDPCIDYDITPEQYSSTYSKGDYSKCFDFTPCQDSSSDFYGYYKRTVKPSRTFIWGYYIEGDQCLKDPCYGTYNISNISNYDDHCYDCTPCPYSPSGDLENYYRCTENPDTGYELSNGRCVMQPCADYTITDINAYTQNMGPFGEMCVEFDQCNDPNAPDEFKNNYKVKDITASTGWKINDLGECVLCDNAYLCRDKDPGEFACGYGSTNFYYNCYITEHCFNDVNVTSIDLGNDCGSKGNGICYALKMKPYNRTEAPYTCTTINNQTFQFYQKLSLSSCEPDCLCNCNPVYNKIECLPQGGTNCWTGTYNSVTSTYCDTCSMQCHYFDRDNLYINGENPNVTEPRELNQNNHTSAGRKTIYFNDTREWGYCYIGISASPGTYQTSQYSSYGYYWVEDLCSSSTMTGTKRHLVYYSSCDQRNCHNERGPAYNEYENNYRKICSSSQTGYTYEYDSNGNRLKNDDGSDKLSDNPTICGGKKYYDICSSESQGGGDSCTETCDAIEEQPYKNYNACFLHGYANTTPPATVTVNNVLHEFHHKKCDMDCPSYYKQRSYYSACTGYSTDKNCDGETPIAAGMFICTGTQESVGRTVECGGKIYSEACREKCNFDKLEEDCLNDGLCFIGRCRKEENGEVLLFGECTEC